MLVFLHCLKIEVSDSGISAEGSDLNCASAATVQMMSSVLAWEDDGQRPRYNWWHPACRSVGVGIRSTGLSPCNLKKLWVHCRVMISQSTAKDNRYDPQTPCSKKFLFFRCLQNLLLGHSIDRYGWFNEYWGHSLGKICHSEWLISAPEDLSQLTSLCHLPQYAVHQRCNKSVFYSKVNSDTILESQ